MFYSSLRQTSEDSGYRRARLSALISHTGKLTPQFLSLDSVKFHQNARKRVHHHINSVSVAFRARLTSCFRKQMKTGHLLVDRDFLFHFLKDAVFDSITCPFFK